jgi:hypothetical protein
LILRFLNQAVEPTSLWRPEVEPCKCSKQADGATHRGKELQMEQQAGPVMKGFTSQDEENLAQDKRGYGNAIRSPLIFTGSKIYSQKELSRISYINSFIQADRSQHKFLTL